MRIWTIAICMALFSAGAAWAGSVKQNAIACNSKDELDALTIIAASGQQDMLDKVEAELIDGKKCKLINKGMTVEIIDAKRVLAGDPKIRGSEAHRRVAYHIATVKAEGKTYFMHLQNIDD